MFIKTRINKINADNLYCEGQVISILDNDKKPIEDKKLNDYKVIISFDKIDLSTSLKNYDFMINETVIGKVIETDDKEKLISLDISEYQKEIFDDFVKGGPYKAKILWFLSYGAMVKVNEFLGIIKNSDFSNKYLKVSQFYHPGDLIEVEVANTYLNKIYFKPTDMSHEDYQADLSKYKVNDVIIVRISSTRPWGIFVGIAPGVDGLCNNPDNLGLKAGMKIAYKITKINEKGIKGRFVKLIG